MRIRFPRTASFLLVAAFAQHAALAADDPKVTAEVLGVARAQIAAGIAQKPWTERMASIADDYTVFNATAPTRVEGKAVVMGLNTANAQNGSKQLVSEIINPKVQTYGDTAILTFNQLSVFQDKDGKTNTGTQKVTRVYVRQGGAWRNVHGHFSPIAPPAN